MEQRQAADTAARAAARAEGHRWNAPTESHLLAPLMTRGQQARARRSQER
jgi:hypothetical protein